MADESTAGSGPVDDFDVPAPSSDGSGSSTPSTPAVPTTTPAAFSGGETAASPEQPAAPPTPGPLSEFLRAERLPEVPGETPEQTQLRLNAHWQGKSQRFYRDLKAEQERNASAAAQHAEELRQIREAITPMAKDFYARAKAQQVAAAAAEIPDRDSPEYLVWLNEQILLRDEERRESDLERAQQAEQNAAAQQEQEQYRALDDAGFGELAVGLGQVQGYPADPELVEDYGVLTKIAYSSAKAAFPSAPDEQIHEFLSLAQQLDTRTWVMNGVNPRDGVKARAREIREILGINGRQAPAAPAAAQPAQAAPQPSPTATRMAQEAQDAARRAPVTAAAASRPAQSLGGLPDPAGYENDEDYVEAVLAGMLGSEEQRVAAHRKER